MHNYTLRNKGGFPRCHLSSRRVNALRFHAILTDSVFRHRLSRLRGNPDSHLCRNHPVLFLNNPSPTLCCQRTRKDFNSAQCISITVFVKQDISWDNAQMSEKNGELESLRSEIEAVDRDIISSLAKRVRLVKSVGKYKLANNIGFVDEKRRDALLKSWIERGETFGLSKEFVTTVYKIVHDYSVSVEKENLSA